MPKTSEWQRLANHANCEPHPPFDLNLGDRAKRTREEADALAAEREGSRGPQTITHHFGVVFRNGVWFVQDAR